MKWVNVSLLCTILNVWTLNPVPKSRVWPSDSDHVLDYLCVSENAGCPAFAFTVLSIDSSAEYLQRSYQRPLKLYKTKVSNGLYDTEWPNRRWRHSKFKAIDPRHSSQSCDVPQQVGTALKRRFEGICGTLSRHTSIQQSYRIPESRGARSHNYANMASFIPHVTDIQQTTLLGAISRKSHCFGFHDIKQRPIKVCIFVGL